ncbi:hypothetical protein BLOT_014536 [Blomia tropicalis]|nr:hypothetical protein BLOT_014536 [Blomia tropicalis]
MAGPVPSVAEDLRLKPIAFSSMPLLLWSFAANNRILCTAVEARRQRMAHLPNFFTNLSFSSLSPGWPDMLFRWMVGLRLAWYFYMSSRYPGRKVLVGSLGPD